MAGTTQKSRVIPVSFGSHSHQTLKFDNGSTAFVIIDETDDLASTWLPIQGFQQTESESHPSWRSRKYGVNYGDLGGEFFSSKRYVENPEMDYTTSLAGTRSGVFQASYKGPVLAVGPSDMEYPPYANSSSQELDALGATAIARSSPTNPIASFSVFLGELSHEGLPSVTGQKLIELRGMSGRQRRNALGHEYLNYEFGWVPLVNDIRSFAAAIANKDQIIAQFLRDSGRRVRRRYEFPVVRSINTSSQSDVGPWTGPISTSLLTDPHSVGKLEWIDTIEKRRWFSGAFTYFVPSGSDIRSTMKRNAIIARKLYGASLTPDTLWNLAPWSWAVDWFTNAGDVLKNVSARELDGQVLGYGYMMEHTVSRRVYTYSGPTGFQTQNVHPIPITLVSETKLRYKATPYGFGLSWDGLSATQKAIIAALGITRR